MNIQMHDSYTGAIYSSSNCGFCGRTLPENGTCVCGVWKRVQVTQPVYIIELAPGGDKLAKQPGYFDAQQRQRNQERGAA